MSSKPNRLDGCVDLLINVVHTQNQHFLAGWTGHIDSTEVIQKLIEISQAGLTYPPGRQITFEFFI
jgi:hypothetical protein